MSSGARCRKKSIFVFVIKCPYGKMVVAKLSIVLNFYKYSQRVFFHCKVSSLQNGHCKISPLQNDRCKMSRGKIFNGNLETSAPNDPISLDGKQSKISRILFTIFPMSQILVNFTLWWAIFEVAPFEATAPNDPTRTTILQRRHFTTAKRRLFETFCKIWKKIDLFATTILQRWTICKDYFATGIFCNSVHFATRIFCNGKKCFRAFCKM